MAIAYVFDGSGMDQADYDGLMASMGLADLDGDYPDGLLVHLSGAHPGGWQVIDVWRDDEAAGTYYGSERFAAVREAGETVTATPWPLHRIEVRQAFRDRT